MLWVISIAAVIIFIVYAWVNFEDLKDTEDSILELHSTYLELLQSIRKFLGSTTSDAVGILKTRIGESDDSTEKNDAIQQAIKIANKILSMVKKVELKINEVDEKQLMKAHFQIQEKFEQFINIASPYLKEEEIAKLFDYSSEYDDNFENAEDVLELINEQKEKYYFDSEGFINIMSKMLFRHKARIKL